ncbi:TetR/AcrR family transcriptional regulator [Halomonas nitroreducens]|uniref:TetR/AcrR family transcriptional regulator n=1 Tax=Halomonas nitroreducens TaxID=447425 RepID=A0A3S0HP96_9GAMM|nr:TetR/AcrR family transcriptional regulator [Halomonas nitroreducens]RTR02434.1 TetR/AcrR family transcriptional regulator [Halomonas nitroreducens]
MSMTPVHRRHDEAPDRQLADSVLFMALQIAEEVGWSAVTLTEVAARLGIPAARILDHYRDLDDVANAWFLQGWRAMLADAPSGFTDWPPRERLEHCLLAWLDALAEHRRVTVQMLRTKAHLPHPHTWLPMVFDLSRTVQWWRQAAHLAAPYGSRRARLEELALTTLFLATLRRWARDDSPGQHATRQYLSRCLARGERLGHWLGKAPSPPGRGAAGRF